MDNNCTERQLLEKLLAERDELDQLIAILQKRLSKNWNVETDPPSIAAAPSVNKGEFFGMSRAEAAIALLRKVKRTLSTNEILKALKETGLDMSGKNVLSSLYTALMRHPETRRVAKNTWGLKEWYPHLKEQPAKKKNGIRSTNEEPGLDDDPEPDSSSDMI